MTTYRTVREAHQWASSLFEANGIADGRMQSEWMLQHILGWDRTRFFMDMNEVFVQEKDEQFRQMVERRLQGEPLQYILGETQFYGLRFNVDSRVLIPRPETELLIETLIGLADKKWGKDASLKAVDIGTGSGAIAVTLAKEKPLWNVTTVDISTEAIAVAKTNAALNEVTNVTFLHGSCLTPVKDEKFHIVVSNPPYIPSRDVLQLEEQVKDYEPHLALDGGEDGLDFYRELTRDALPLLKDGGFVIYEIGDDQAYDVIALFKEQGYANVYALKDLAGKDRIVIGEK